MSNERPDLNTKDDEASLKAAIIHRGQQVLELEASALQRLKGSLGESFAQAVLSIYQCLDIDKGGRLICTGVGKSGHVARKIAATFASTGTPAYYVHPTEASHGDLGMIAQGDIILALSKSGETRELADILQYAKKRDICIIGMTANQESALGHNCDIPLIIIPDAEACDETQAPTTSTTLMMALGDALAVSVLKSKGFKSDDFKAFHPGGKLGAVLTRVDDIMARGDALPLVQQGVSFAMALEVMTKKGFGCLGVTDASGALTGMLTDGDIRRLVISAKSYSVIDEAMVESNIVLSENVLASEALHLFQTHKISQIFRLNDKREPIGLIHMQMLLKIGLL
jgi:arabinose-5-phosphate isomerase